MNNINKTPFLWDPASMSPLFFLLFFCILLFVVFTLSSLCISLYSREHSEKLHKHLELFDKSEEEDEPIVLYDYCVDYELEDELQEEEFNRDFNEEDLKILIEHEKGGRRDLTEQFFNAITKRIIGGGHFFLFIIGKTNSGKSSIASTIALFYKAAFKRIHGVDIKIHICFDDTEVEECIPKLEFGDLIFRDESSKATERGSRNLVTHVDNVLRTFRSHQNSVIFVNPQLIEDPMIDYYLDTRGKNKKKRITRGILHIQRNDVRSMATIHYPIGLCYFELHHDEDFEEEYRKRKDENLKKLKAKGGRVNPIPDIVKLRRDARILVDKCRENHNDTKKAMEIYMLEYNEQFDPAIDGDKLIGGDDHFNELLFEHTKLYLASPEKMRRDAGESPKTKPKEENLIIQLRDYIFPYNDQEILEIAKKNNNFRDPKRDFEFYEKIVGSGGRIKEKDLQEYYPNLNASSSTNSVIRKIRHLINHIKGHLHEEKYFKHLKKVYETSPYNKVILEGQSGKPDIYVILEETNELHIFACKNLKLGKKMGSYPMKKIERELQSAFEKRHEYKKIRVFVPLVNNYTNTFHLYEIKNILRTSPLKLT